MINAKCLSDAFISGANNIINHREKVDSLNVFPVPDGDTGTNMGMTMTAAKNELLSAKCGSVGEVAHVAASALLRGARGNSGVITSLIFRGFSKGLKGREVASGVDLVESLESGVAAAYKAVMKPTEGTILTVARVAAEKGRASVSDGITESALWDIIVDAARDALAHTPEQLPVLKKAGVVDAGGQGLVYIFEGIQKVFHGEEMVLSSNEEGLYPGNGERPLLQNAAGQMEEVDINNPYCTEFLILRDDAKRSPDSLRSYLQTIGDCVVVVDDEEIIKCHVHTKHPGLALEKAGQYGMLTKLKIENMVEQYKSQVAASKESETGASGAVEIDPSRKAGFVAIAAGSGLESLFLDLGVDQVVSGGQTMNPSTEDILNAVLQVPATDIFVFPNNKNIIMAAEQTVKLARKNGNRRVHVIPTISVPQGVGAMVAYDESLEAKENAANMTVAAEYVHTGSVTFAARDSDFDGHQIHEGELLGLENGKVAFTGSDLNTVVSKVVTDMLEESSEFVTVYYGSDISDEQAAETEKAIASVLPSGVDLTFIQGGQPVYYFIVAVE